MRVLVTGASGLIGKSLICSLLREGTEVVALGRTPDKILELPRENVFSWDGRSVPPPAAFQGVDAIVHLAGENIAGGRWTPARKKALIESRTLTTRALLEGIAALAPALRPKTFLSTSAIGFYGDTGGRVATEATPAGEGFLSEVCQLWENEALAAKTLGLRLAILRFGVVLAKEGGALAKMGPTPLGDGRQWMSWIHREDLLSFIKQALVQEKIQGVFNLVAPEAVQNKVFTRQLCEVMRFPFTLPTPSFVLKLILGEMSAVILESQRVLPKALLEMGFQFKFPRLKEALADLFSENSFLDNYQFVNQFVPLKKSEVFPFFAQAENLEILTPPWLNFRITKKSSEVVTQGMLIYYRLKIRGIPVRWKTRISEWRPDDFFVDDQLKGPYTKWHHCHYFEEVMGGTLLRDEVTFRVPGWYFGRLLLVPWIRRDVNTIFAYRQKKIAELVQARQLK